MHDLNRILTIEDQETGEEYQIFLYDCGSFAFGSAGSAINEYSCKDAEANNTNIVSPDYELVDHTVDYEYYFAISESFPIGQPLYLCIKISGYDDKCEHSVVDKEHLATFEVEYPKDDILLPSLTNVTLLYLSAENIRNDGDFNRAIRYYDRILELQPLNFHVLNTKGILYTQLSNYSEAIKSFNESMNVNSDFTNASKNKDELLNFLTSDELLKQFDESMKIISDMNLVIHPNELNKLLDVGKILYDNKRVDDSIRYYDKVLEFDPSNKRAGELMKNALEARGIVTPTSNATAFF